MAQEVPIPSYKVVVLGDSSVGKTSLVHRFTTSEFDVNITNTIGAAFITKDMESNDKSKRVKYEIWDTAGQERYRSLTPMYYRNSKVALVCYDLSSDESFDKAKYWIEQIKLNNETNDDGIAILLVGTKLDLVETPNLADIDDYLALNRQIKHFTTSSKTGHGIDDIFDYILDTIPQQFFDNHNEALRLENIHKKKSRIHLTGHLPQTNSCC